MARSRQFSDSSSEEDVGAGRESLPQPYAFEPTSARNELAPYQNDSNLETTGSDDGLEVADRTSGTFWCQCGNCVPMPSNAECTCCAEIANI